MLANVQADSEQSQNGTTTSSVPDRSFQVATSLLNVAPVKYPSVADSGSARPTPTSEPASTSMPAASSDAPSTAAPSSIQTPDPSSAASAASAAPVAASDETGVVGELATGQSLSATEGASSASSSQESAGSGQLMDGVKGVIDDLKTSVSAPLPSQQITVAANAPVSAGPQQPVALTPTPSPQQSAPALTVSVTPNQSSIQKMSAKSAPEPGSQLSLTSVGGSTAKSADAKSADKDKIEKERVITAKTGATGLITSDPSVSASPSATSSDMAAPLSVPDAGGSPSLQLPASRNSHKAESTESLAFALRIQGAGTANSMLQSSPGSSAATDTAAANPQASFSDFSAQMTSMVMQADPKVGLKPALSSGLVGTASAVSQNSVSLATTSAFTIPSVANSSAETSQDPAPVEESASIAALPEDQPGSGQPVKTVQLQITGADNQKVDLKLVEKFGALTMSVRSADSSLNKALQQNLPDLTAKLSDQQIRAEWWRPDSQQAEPPGTTRGSAGSTNPGNTDPGNQNKGNSGQQNGRGAPQPDWLDDLSTPKSNQNGTQFSWHL